MALTRGGSNIQKSFLKLEILIDQAGGAAERGGTIQGTSWGLVSLEERGGGGVIWGK